MITYRRSFYIRLLTTSLHGFGFYSESDNVEPPVCARGPKSSSLVSISLILLPVTGSSVQLKLVERPSRSVFTMVEVGVDGPHAVDTVSEPERPGKLYER